MSRGYLIALFAICAAYFSMCVEHISASLPYPQHIDEQLVAEKAARVLTSGDFHPRSFHYPSLPIYLTAAGMAVGFVITASDLEVEKIRIDRDLGDVSFPFYTLPRVVETARRLFVLLSAVALAASGIIAWRLLRRPGAVLLAPLVLAMSSEFFSKSWSYLNVDIVSTCFVLLGTAAIYANILSPLRLAVLPAICVGLAAGSKYLHGLLLLPLLIAICLFVERGRRFEAAVVAVACTSISFLAVVPYSMIDLPGFLNGLANVANSYYHTAHPGDTGDPGIGTLFFYIKAIGRDFGGAGLLLGLVGLASIARDWRRALVFVSYPVALLALLSMYQAEYQRHILPVFPLVAILITAGIYSLHGLAMRVPGVRRIEPPRFRRTIGAAVLLGIFALGLNVPVRRFVEQVEVEGDTRVNAVAWIKQHVAADTTVIIPEELQLDFRPLTAAGYPTRVVKFRTLDAADIDSLVKGIPGPVIVLAPRWCSTPWGRKPEEAANEAATLNEAIARARIEPLVEFNPGGCTLVNYDIPNNGNPAFAIGGQPGAAGATPGRSAGSFRAPPAAR